MACVSNDLRQVIVLSNPDYVYRVPNYCVCDPVFERDYDKIKEKNKDIESVKIKIILYYLAKNKNIKLHVTNKMKVKKVKEAFAKKMEIDLKTHKIRLLFRGQELLDDNPLYYNNVEEMSKIQVMEVFPRIFHHRAYPGFFKGSGWLRLSLYLLHGAAGPR